MDLDVEPGKVDIHTLKNTCNEHGSTNTIILELLLCMCKGMCPHSSPYLKELPPVIPPSLAAERQWYLCDSIRPFCPDDDQDTTSEHKITAAIGQFPDI